MDKRMLARGIAAVALMAAPVTAPAAGPLDSYAPVTQERLEKPEDANWLQYRRTYDSWGYSPLSQVNAGNVKDMVPVWSFSTGVNEGHQSPPVVNNGVMFITTPQAQVIALDAKTGDLLWRYKRELPEDLTQLHPTNRGVALLGDKVYVGTVDAFIVALDAKTGKVVWETRLNSGVTGVPSTYMIDGVQYIAVQAGWGVDAERMLGGISSLLPPERRAPAMTQGGVVWVFALGKDQSKQQASTN